MTADVINVCWYASNVREMGHTDITAEAVNPVRTVRFAVMNLYSESVYVVDVKRAAKEYTSQFSRYLLRWSASRP